MITEKKNNSLKNINIYLIYLSLGIIAFLFNFWTSNQGVFPIDTFLHYDSAFKILNGEKPIKDFWIIHGITLDYIQSIFFYFLGVNWVSYITHSSIFNSVITLFFFTFLRNLNIGTSYSAILSICFLTLAYPISGVPFIDHHATFFSLISIFIFYFGITNKNYKYFFLIPFLFGLAFFSKPVPSIYIVPVFGIIYLIYFFSEKKFKPILFLIYGSVLFFLMLFLFLKVEDIPIKNFIDQLILYPMSIGDQRLDSIEEAISNRLFNYKFIILSLIYLIFFLAYKKNFLKFSKEKIFFCVLIVFFSLSMIVHQILTKNQNFIFFLIPINLGLILYLNNIISLKYKKFINLFFIIFCVLLTLKYNERFNDKRKFHELEYVKLENAIGASTIDKSLYPLKWITSRYPNPNDEIELIKKIIEVIENSEKNTLLLTNYNFIDSVTQKKVYSAVKNFDSVTIPNVDNEFVDDFTSHFMQQLEKKNISQILMFFPSIKDSDTLINSFKEYQFPICFDYQNINLAIGIIEIKSC